ncbi:uncharacterized protein BO66DRAFT_392470 [Aspergillus aculeatinus CBS 121060]|uniref:Uncharacterized protein n=1 Tax=Aspergillus aculeatinus CBS 121060 TaxID=1448322 RepID=A0ACD1H6I4_9EURO|nr:hypothetical protein BO66DRAFT_392470 [Aspergillus aculeatinus CBS 121060]RAH69222.1 hypothetical protein BO66DRAFT_392470 [Aspergillus aculeatinus CBS 121060]
MPDGFLLIEGIASLLPMLPWCALSTAAYQAACSVCNDSLSQCNPTTFRISVKQNCCSAAIVLRGVDEDMAKIRVLLVSSVVVCCDPAPSWREISRL